MATSDIAGGLAGPDWDLRSFASAIVVAAVSDVDAHADHADEHGAGQVDTPTLPIGIHDQDPKAWFEVFFAVEDLDASLAQVTTLGGHVEGEVHVDAGFGRWSECTDDQGVRFGLRQPA